MLNIDPRNPTDPRSQRDFAELAKQVDALLNSGRQPDDTLGFLIIVVKPQKDGDGTDVGFTGNIDARNAQIIMAHMAMDMDPSAVVLVSPQRD